MVLCLLLSLDEFGDVIVLNLEDMQIPAIAKQKEHPRPARSHLFDECFLFFKVIERGTRGKVRVLRIWRVSS